jgi:Cdc6-like AAA superfamily ATPase
LPHHHKDELFETAHVDDNEVEAVEDLCDVLDEEEYELRMRMEEEEEGGDMDDDDGEERKQSDQEAASASKKKQKNKSGANDDDAADEKSSRRRVFFMRQRYDDDRRVFRPLVREKKERGAGLRQSLAAAAAPSSKRGGASSSGGAGGKPQSIYAQACAQLQLSAAPPKLPCRDKEHQQIRDFVERGIRRGYADGGLYIAGVPGTGQLPISSHFSHSVFFLSLHAFLFFRPDDTLLDNRYLDSTKTLTRPNILSGNLSERQATCLQSLLQFVVCVAAAVAHSLCPPSISFVSPVCSVLLTVSPPFVAGKTATVQRVLNELSLVPSLPNFEFVEINGMRLPEPAQLYTALWKSLTGKQASAAKACTYLEARFRSDNARRPVCVLLVDELDYMLTRQQHVLYNLFDWPSRRSARLLVIGISNTIDLPDLLMPRVHSRLGLTKLHFEPYTKEQIGLIIADRLRSLPAFGEGAVELCARKIASISGDMRRALQICRRAAEICEEQQIRAAAAASKLKGSAAAAAAAAGASASSSSSSAAAASVSASVPLVNEDHIMSAIADLQNSSFIQWLRVRAPRVPYEPLLLCAMLQGMKFASAAAGGGATVGSGRNNNGGMGDENPFVSMHALVLHATTLLDTKGYLALLSSRCDGISAAELAQNRPSVEADWARLVRQWAEVRLVHLTHLRGERHPRVQLNVLTDDIEHAYRNEPLWQHLRG